MHKFHFYRKFLVIAALGALAGFGATVAAAATTGVAYDEVLEQYTARPLPLPKDFSTVWADTANKAGALHRTAYHIALLGNLRRTEYADGTIILDRPDLGQYIHLDSNKKTYWTAPWKPRDTYSTGPVLPFKNARGTVTAAIESVHDSWPSITMDGRSYRGETVRAIIEVNPSGNCTLAQSLALITIFATDGFPEQEFSGQLYIAPFNFEPVTLSAFSGCTVSAPADLLSQFPTYPGFMLYRTAQVKAAPADLRFQQLGDTPVALLMRGNVKILSYADQPLFEIPPGYQKIVAPASEASCFKDASVLTEVAPAFPASERGVFHGTATAYVEVSLDPAGKIAAAKIFRSSGVQALDDAALRAASQSTFSPKISGCKAVPGDYLFKVTFQAQ